MEAPVPAKKKPAAPLPPKSKAVTATALFDFPGTEDVCWQLMFNFNILINIDLSFNYDISSVFLFMFICFVYWIENKKKKQDELPFAKGDILEILEQDGDWWEAKLNGKTGSIPANYVKLRWD